jgi:hypothetical protein
MRTKGRLQDSHGAGQLCHKSQEVIRGRTQGYVHLSRIRLGTLSWVALFEKSEAARGLVA